MIAERIGRPNSMPPLRKRLAQIRPEYVGIDPVDRTTYATLATRILLPAKGRGVQGHGRAEQRLSGDELPARPVLRLAGRSTSSSQTGC